MLDRMLEPKPSGEPVSGSGGLCYPASGTLSGTLGWSMPSGLNLFRADDDPVNRMTTYILWTIAMGIGLLQDEVPHQFGVHGMAGD
jgi:hypothetical protein